MGITKIDQRWDEQVDVLVLGAGPVGMAAAIVSKNEGLEPLILEKTDPSQPSPADLESLAF
jgi:thioredoxin reductase